MAEAMMEKERVEPSNVSMYPRDWATVQQVVNDLGLSSVSAGLRHIVRDYRRLKSMEQAMLQYLRLENGLRLGHITQDEFLDALGVVTVLLNSGGDGHGDGE